MKKIIISLFIVFIITGFVLGKNSKFGVFFTNSIGISDLPNIADKEQGFGFEFSLTNNIFFQLSYLYADGVVFDLDRFHSHNICFLAGYKFRLSNRINFLPKIGLNLQQFSRTGFSIKETEFSNHDIDNWEKKSSRKYIALGFDLEFKVTDNVCFLTGWDFYRQTPASGPFVGLKLHF